MYLMSIFIDFALDQESPHAILIINEYILITFITPQVAECMNYLINKTDTK